MGEWRHSSTILNLSTKWRCVASLSTLPKDNSSSHQLYRREQRTEKPLSSIAAGTPNPRQSSPQVTIPTELSQFPYKNTMKVKWSLCLTMPWTLMASGCIDSRFHDLDTSWKWAVSFTSWPLYQVGKSPLPYPLDKRLGGSQNLSWPYGEVKIFDPTGTWNLAPSHPAHSHSLHQLRYPGSIKRQYLGKNSD
jgi:hypothetical protein